MIVAGTRPEVIKLDPVIRSLEKLGVNYVFVWSGLSKGTNARIIEGVKGLQGAGNTGAPSGDSITRRTQGRREQANEKFKKTKLP
jgi:hypothetical protein